jgi:ligand-binding sensor domain-containing protein
MRVISILKSIISRKKISVSVIIILLVLLGNAAKAQVFIQKYSAVNFATNLFQNHSINCVTMDANGRVWVGTENSGLFISKGNKMVPFSKVSDKMISAFYLHQRYLYVGTSFSIIRIHIDSLTAETLPLKDENNRPIHNYFIPAYIKGNKMLFYTGDNTAAYYEYDLRTGKSKFLFNCSDAFRALKTDALNHVTKLWAIETTGLLEHDLLRNPVSRHDYFKEKTPPVLSVYEARLDAQDTLWCAASKGLVALDINSRQHQIITFPQYDVYEIKDAALYGQNIICATANAGIIIWNRKSKTASQINHLPDDPYSLLSNNVHKLKIINNLLVSATDQGVSIIPLDTALQFVFTLRKSEKIHNLAKGKQDWLAGVDNHIFLLNGNHFIAQDSLTFAKDEHAITAQEIAEKNWLIITNKRLLWWHDKQLTTLKIKSGEYVLCNRIVKHNDGIYYFCGQTGAYSWHVGNNYFDRLIQTDNRPFQWNSAIIPFNDSILWVNAYSSFITEYIKRGNNLHYSKLLEATYNINDWLFLNSQNLLLATTNGMSKLDVKHKQLLPLDASFRENIYRLLFQNQDTLLVGERSLYRYNSGKIQPYATPFSGLQNIASLDKLITGAEYIWYASNDELYRVPFQQTIDTTKYYYTDVRYRDMQIGNGIELSVNTPLQITVNSVSCIPYVKPNVQYRLLEIETKWNILEGDQINYTHLSSGKYTLVLHITAGDQTLYYRTITIISHPAWYQTIWFIVGCILLFIIAVLSIFRWRVHTVRRKSQQELLLQKKLSELENKALRAQINPHFLFNTLNSINHFILANNKKEASHYLTRFAQLVRLVLDNSRHEYISLERELEALIIYLELEMMRRDNAFDYSLSIRKDITATPFFVPPLILQPFVENAIWHGLASVFEDGFIEIIVSAAGEDGICITIEDNGVGYESDTQKSKKTHSSFGMAGTLDRLRQMHPKNNCKIETLYNDDDNPAGTKISIFIYND